jgi:hypothetical protein
MILNKLFFFAPPKDRTELFQSATQAKSWLKKINFVLSKASERSAILNVRRHWPCYKLLALCSCHLFSKFNFATNITDENREKIEAFSFVLNYVQKKVIKTAKKFYE